LRKLSSKLSIEILLELRSLSVHEFLKLSGISSKQYYLVRSATANASHSTIQKINKALNIEHFQLFYLLDRLYTLGARVTAGALLIPPTVQPDVANAIFQRHPIFYVPQDSANAPRNGIEKPSDCNIITVSTQNQVLT